MRRLVIIAVAAVAAGGIAVTPALAGLHGNPSFSKQIQVPAPSQAKQPTFPADDHGGLIGHPEPGDDRGASPEVEPGDDRVSGTSVIEPGDDHGGLSPSAAPGDDHGGARSGSSSGRTGS